MAIKFLNTVQVDTDVLYVDATNDRVGIGTTSPDNILHVRAGDTGYDSQVGADTMLILETTNVSNSLQFSSTTSGNQYIMFGDDDPNAGWIAYAHSDNSLNFRTNGSACMRIDSSGNVGIGTTSPTAAKLVVDSDTAPQILVKNSGGGNAQILFEDNDGLTQNASITFDQAGDNTLSITTEYDSPNDLNKIKLVPGGEVAMTLSGGDDSTGTNGSITFNGYVGTRQTGTPTYLLGTDASGNIVKTNTVPGSGAGPYLPLAGGTLSGGLVGTSGYFTSNLTTNGVLTIQSSNPYIQWNNAAGTRLGYIQHSTNLVINADSGQIVLNTAADNDILINPGGTGNVGIGTTTPTQKLEVNGVIESPYLEYKPFVFYDFNSDTVSQWGTYNATLSTPSKSVTRFTTTGTDANLNRNFDGSGYNSPAIPGGQNQIIRIRYKWISGTAGGGEIFYATSGHGYSSSYYKSYDLNTDGEYHTLVLDMSNLSSGGTDWIDNDITAIRFDLINITPAVIDIDWIAVGGNGWGTQYFENDVAFMNGNVGIGTTSPIDVLSLERITNANVLTDYKNSTGNFSAGVLASGNFAINESNVSTRLTIEKTSGNVGIGTTSPTFKLHVNSTDASDNVAYIHHNNAAQSSGDVLKVRSDAGDNAGSALLNVANNTGSALYVRGDRNVGIGLTDPDSRLDINAGVTNITAGPAVRISKGASPIGLIRYDTVVIEANDVATIRIGESDGTVSSIMSGDNNLRINSTDPIKFYTAGTTTGEAHAGQGGTFAMIIDNSQNVGIGTTTPALRLNVLGATGYPATSGTTQTGVFRVSGGTGLYNVIDMGVNETTDTAWIQATRANNLGANDKLAINPNGGNVGIGTDSPGAKLEIYGNNATRNTLLNLLTLNGGASASNPYDGFGVGVKFNGRDYSNAVRDYAYIYGVIEDQSSSSTPAGDPGFEGQLRFYTNTGGASATLPTQKMVITAAGNVGIGTSSPAYKFVVSNAGAEGLEFIPTLVANKSMILSFNRSTSTYNALQLTGSSIILGTDSAGTAVTVINNGNVGIGTTTPDAKLETEDSSAGITYGLSIINNYDTSAVTTSKAGINFGRNNTNSRFAEILGGQQGVSTYQYGSLSFGTRTSDALGVETKMTIRANGNVGIGTTTPSAKLEVNVGVNSLKISGRDTYIDSSIDSANANIYVTQAGVGDFSQLAGSLVLQARTQGTVYRDIIFAGGLTSGDALMTIQGEGNVGIGTTTPATKLQVIESGSNNTAIFENSGQTYSYTAIKVAEALNNKAALSFAVGNALASTDIFGEISGSVTNNGGALTGDLVFKTNPGDNLTERMRIDSAGDVTMTERVGIGVTSFTAGVKLEVAGNIKADGSFYLYSGTTRYFSVGAYSNAPYINTGTSGGTVYIGAPTTWVTNLHVQGTTTATNFILSSDERLKENIEKACDNRIKADWKTFELKTEKGQKRYGVIAQELEKTNPEFVREDTQGFKSVAYIDLLIAKIAELEARLEKAGI